MKGNRKNFLGTKYLYLTCTAKLSNHIFEWTCICGNKILIKGCEYRKKCSCGCIINNSNKGKYLRKRTFQKVSINAEYSTHKGNCKRRNLTPLSRIDWEVLYFYHVTIVAILIQEIEHMEKHMKIEEVLPYLMK